MKSFARTWIVVALLALPLAPGSVVSAQGTRDGVTPAVEDVCTGMMGAAFGLCVAFCEANDCDLYPDLPACEVLRENYANITGEETFPCEGDGGEG